MIRFCLLTAWVLSSLGMTLLGATFFIVPGDAFACFSLSNCENDCKNACKNGCKSSCESGCKTSCLATYPGGHDPCSSNHEAYLTCISSCNSTCTTNCNSDCSTVCTAECSAVASTLATCEASCKSEYPNADQHCKYAHCVATKCVPPSSHTVDDVDVCIKRDGFCYVHKLEYECVADANCTGGPSKCSCYFAFGYCHCGNN